MAWEKPSFPQPSSPVRCDGTVLSSCQLVQEQCLGLAAEIIRINFCSIILNVADTQD